MNDTVSTVFRNDRLSFPGRIFKSIPTTKTVHCYTGVYYQENVVKDDAIHLAGSE